VATSKSEARPVEYLACSAGRTDEGKKVVMMTMRLDPDTFKSDNLALPLEHAKRLMLDLLRAFQSPIFKEDVENENCNGV